MKLKLFRILFLIILAFIFGSLGSITVNKFYQSSKQTEIEQRAVNNFSLARFRIPDNNEDSDINSSFIQASSKSCPTVVFVKAITEGNPYSYNFWDLFFNYFDERRSLVASGSGVIVSADGYIVTNNHVIKNANKVEIVVNGKKKNYEAEIIGVDESSDLVLLKIKADNLPFIEFANSDNVRVGEWVLAVGNPFNLTSTVTAGIVSAKGRNINIYKKSFQIESFIQTDAAINAGNSGGALVNLKGELIGINTAILTKTGSYAGYGFSIPSNIVKKTISDLKEYGIVQRAFIEADMIDIDEKIAEKLNDDEIKGVYIIKVNPDGNAEKAGMKIEDVILRIKNVGVKDLAAFEEQLAYFRPGDKIKVEVLRNNKVVPLDITLHSSEGTTELLKDTKMVSRILGASFNELNSLDKKYYDIDHGIKVFDIKNGIIKEMNIPNGFIILSINNIKYSSAEKLVKTIENYKGRLTIKGFTPDGWLVKRSVYLY